MEEFKIALFLTVVNTKLIDYLKAPVNKKWPDLDLWWVVYLALATGVALTWASQINLFSEWIADTTVGILLSGVFVGGGSSMIYDIFTDRPGRVTVTAGSGDTIAASATVTPEIPPVEVGE